MVRIATMRGQEIHPLYIMKQMHRPGRASDAAYM